MKQIVLLTSTIQPKSNQPQLLLTDPLERLADYTAALKYYLSLAQQGVLDRVIFVDNSGFPLGELIASFGTDYIEWISFYGLDYPSDYHRGYGEFKLIDYAFDHSTTLQNLTPEDVVWKITGRYIVANMPAMIHFAPGRFELYCDIRGKWIEMSVMAWTIAGYEKFIKDSWQLFASSGTPEVILVKRLRSQPGNKGGVARYYWQPYILGRRAFDGSHYIGRLTIIKHLLIQLANIIKMPFRKT